MPDHVPDGFTGQDPVLSFRRVERVLDVSAHQVEVLIGQGELKAEAKGVKVSELVAYRERSGFSEGRLVRAYSVLPRDRQAFATSQVADLLGFSPDVVRRLIDDGRLQGYRLPGGRRLVSRIALACYLADNPGRLAIEMGLRTKPKRKAKGKAELPLVVNGNDLDDGAIQGAAS